MKTPLSILLTSGVCAAQLAFSASLVPNGGFEEGADAPVTWGAPNPAKGIDFPVEDGKGREEIGPPVARGEAFDAAVEIGPEDALYRFFHQGCKIDVVCMPYGAGYIVVEIFAKTADVSDTNFCTLSVFGLCSELYVGHHQALLVGFVSVTSH